MGRFGVGCGRGSGRVVAPAAAAVVGERSLLGASGGGNSPRCSRGEKAADDVHMSVLARQHQRRRPLAVLSSGGWTKWIVSGGWKSHRGARSSSGSRTTGAPSGRGLSPGIPGPRPRGSTHRQRRRRRPRLLGEVDATPWRAVQKCRHVVPPRKKCRADLRHLESGLCRLAREFCWVRDWPTVAHVSHLISHACVASEPGAPLVRSFPTHCEPNWFRQTSAPSPTQSRTRAPGRRARPPPSAFGRTGTDRTKESRDPRPGPRTGVHRRSHTGARIGQIRA